MLYNRPCNIWNALKSLTIEYIEQDTCRSYQKLTKDFNSRKRWQTKNVSSHFVIFSKFGNR